MLSFIQGFNNVPEYSFTSRGSRAQSNVTKCCSSLLFYLLSFCLCIRACSKLTKCAISKYNNLFRISVRSCACCVMRLAVTALCEIAGTSFVGIILRICRSIHHHHSSVICQTHDRSTASSKTIPPLNAI
jgi:hypothetical protein